MNSEKKYTLNNRMTHSSAIRALLSDLGSKNGRVRQVAREKLVMIGRAAVPHLIGLLDHPNDILRWEGVKALGGIADPDSVPALIKALSDPNEQVRWLAAEGLIAVGPTVIGPVLEELLCDPKSLLIQRGVHRVLTGLSSGMKMKELYDLIGVLNHPRPELYAPSVAYRILRNVGRSRSRRNFCSEDRNSGRRAA